MKFVVQLMSKNSGRIGCLTKVDTELKTPLVLHYTKVGSIPYLSREVFDMVTEEKQGILIPIETTYLLHDSVKAFERGISPFVGLEHTFSCVTLKDTGKSSQSFYSRESVSISTRAGKVAVNPEVYMDVIESFKPDIFHTLCDGDTSSTCGNKRILNAVNRSENFLKSCIQRYKNSTVLSDSLLIAPVEGGYSPQYREEAIKSLNAIENQEMIGGYFLDGLHSNSESANQVEPSKVCEIVQKCLSLLPSNKLKMMLGAYSPALTIELVQLGVDIFDTTYTYLATSKNYALTFNFDINKSRANDSEFRIDLADSIYKDQFIPFVEGCACLACRNHTRAYTQHLVHTRELLGPILLTIHNTHHYLEFFKAIRRNIANDTLPKLLALVREQQDAYVKEKAERSDAEEISDFSNDSSSFKKMKSAECD